MYSELKNVGVGALNQSPDCTAEREKEISRELEVARIQMAELLSGLHHLSERIEPVMRPSGPECPGQVGPAALPVVTQVGNAINSISHEIGGANGLVRDMLSRLELQ